MTKGIKKIEGAFLRVLLLVIGFWLALHFLFPLVAGWVASKDWFVIQEGLPSSGKEFSIYFTLALVAIFCWVSYSEERWQEFLRPMIRLLQSPSRMRTTTLALFPLLVGAVIFHDLTAGGVASSFVAIKHPTPPDRFSKMKNPYRAPDSQLLAAFEVEVKEGKYKEGDWTEPALLNYIAAVKEGSATDDMRRAAFERRVIEEGRILFLKNCRVCHGTKAMGDGPMARGLLRQPADFTGVETIATLVEGAVFWRIKEGGISLPREGGPWESAMPRWGTDLTDDEIWKIIMAEYDIAGNKPREPEKQ